MMFIDELKKAFDIMTKPSKATKETMDIKGGLVFYYKVLLIPMVIAIIVGIIGIVALSYSWTGLASSILDLLVLVPIGFFIGAAWLHLFGKFILKTFKGTYVNTFNGAVYSYMPYVMLFWLSMIVSVFAIGSISPTGVSAVAAAGAAVASIIAIISVIWSFIISLFALANQHKTTKLKVFITQIVAAIPIIIIVLIAAFFAIGFFNTGFPNSTLGGSNLCIGQPGFSCSTATISTGGVLSFNFDQGTGATMYNVSMACTSASTATPPQSLQYTPISSTGRASEALAPTSISSGTTLYINSLECSSSNLAPVGTEFLGSVWASYSTSPGGSQTFVKVATVGVKSS